jgi:hypothetical protein
MAPVQCIFFVFNFEDLNLCEELIVKKSLFIRIKKRNAKIFVFNKERDQGVRISLKDTVHTLHTNSATQGGYFYFLYLSYYNLSEKETCKS